MSRFLAVAGRACAVARRYLRLDYARRTGVARRRFGRRFRRNGLLVICSSGRLGRRGGRLGLRLRRRARYGAWRWCAHPRGTPSSRLGRLERVGRPATASCVVSAVVHEVEIEIVRVRARAERRNPVGRGLGPTGRAERVAQVDGRTVRRDHRPGLKRMGRRGAQQRVAHVAANCAGVDRPVRRRRGGDARTRCPSTQLKDAALERAHRVRRGQRRRSPTRRRCHAARAPRVARGKNREAIRTASAAVARGALGRV